MAAPTTPQEAIEQNTLGPQRVTAGGQTVQQHPIPDQIAADNHLANKTAATKNHLGLRNIKLVPPGAG